MTDYVESDLSEEMIAKINKFGDKLFEFVKQQKVEPYVVTQAAFHLAATAYVQTFHKDLENLYGMREAMILNFKGVLDAVIQSESGSKTKQ